MRIRPVVPTLSSRTSPAGTSGWHPARSAGTGVPHRDPTRGRRLLLQHPQAVSSSPHPPCMVSVSWCHRLPWRSFPSTNGHKIIPAPVPVPLLREGREKNPPCGPQVEGNGRDRRRGVRNWKRPRAAPWLQVGAKATAGTGAAAPLARRLLATEQPPQTLLLLLGSSLGTPLSPPCVQGLG